MENIKKSVISGEFIIEIDKTGHVSVYRIYDNVIDSLREIYQTEKLEYDPTWNTRQMGNNLIKKYCTDDDNTQAIIGDYLVHRRENGSIETFRDYGKGKVTEALKEVAQKVGLKVESGWNTQQLGSKLVDFINNKPKNTYIMQEFKLDGRMTVASMKDLFKTLTGGTLRVKDGNKKADESATLASIRKESDNKSGAFALNPEMTIGDFKAKMLSDFGLKVEVGTPDDWVSVPDGITLGQLRELPKNAVRAQLEALVKNVSTSTSPKLEGENKETDNKMTTDREDTLPFSGEYEDGLPVVNVDFNFIEEDTEEAAEAKGGIAIMQTSHSSHDIDEGNGVIVHLRILDDNESFQDWHDGNSDDDMKVWNTIDHCNMVTGDSYGFFYAALDGATHLQKQWLSTSFVQAIKSSFLFNELSSIGKAKFYKGPDAIVHVRFNGWSGNSQIDFKIENGEAYLWH